MIEMKFNWYTFWKSISPSKWICFDSVSVIFLWLEYHHSTSIIFTYDFNTERLFFAKSVTSLLCHSILWNRSCLSPWFENFDMKVKTRWITLSSLSFVTGKYSTTLLNFFYSKNSSQRFPGVWSQLFWPSNYNSLNMSRNAGLMRHLKARVGEKVSLYKQASLELSPFCLSPLIRYI